MGYYGHSAYRGDYYGRGDYYRHPMAGDPGFFDFISDVGGAVLNVAKAALPVAAPIVGGMFGGPAGMALGAAAGGLLSRVMGPGAPIPSPPLLSGGAPPVWAATAPGTGSTLAMIPSSPFGGVSAPRLTGMPGGSKMAGFSIGGPKGLVYDGNQTQSGGGAGGQMVHLHRGKRPYYGPTHTVFRHVDSWQVKDSRRMNPLNPHALRRSLRRARAFTKVVSKSLRFTKPGHHVHGFKKGKK